MTLFQKTLPLFALFLTLGMSPYAAQAQTADAPSEQATTQTEATKSAPEATAATTDEEIVTPLADAAIETTAREAYIVDYETGTVLYAKNAREKMPTSSMSKVITAYAVFDALKKGDIKMTDTFRVSQKAWSMGGSKMFVPINEDVTVEDLVRGVVVQSGNDATIVLAEGLAGSEDSFVKRLNMIAEKLGMKNSHFNNASGWPDPDHYSTAEDLAILTRYLIHDFPEYYPIFAEHEFTYNGIRQGNRNPLLYKDIGADGVKTGHAEEAGYGLIASAVRDGRRVIVVFNGTDSMQARADEGVKLVTWALMNFKNDTLVKGGDIVGTVPVMYGKVDQVNATPESDLKITVSRNTTSKPHVEYSFLSPVYGPVKKGQKIGQATVTDTGGFSRIVPLVATDDVEEANFFKKIWQKIQSFFK
ncbi:MAG: D-alanyl-D-alanine carboxypeptidase family protein [Pseudobdellovibrionaceae bacterium]